MKTQRFAKRCQKGDKLPEKLLYPCNVSRINCMQKFFLFSVNKPHKIDAFVKLSVTLTSIILCRLPQQKLA